MGAANVFLPEHEEYLIEWEARFAPETIEEIMEAEETILEEVNVVQEEEHPVKPIIELEEAAVTRIAQENDAMRMRLEEETVLEKMGLTSLQFPDPQGKKLIESRQNGIDSEQMTSLKKSMSVSLQDNEKPSTSKQDLIPTPFKRVLLLFTLKKKEGEVASGCDIPTDVRVLQKERNEKKLMAKN
ncbi:hypothetical protein FQA39_LY07940 [Lamprigera yunnana]|nr:hypothetical protein FQA39_LY07940 [Lamprigera yunnana]